MMWRSCCGSQKRRWTLQRSSQRARRCHNQARVVAAMLEQQREQAGWRAPGSAQLRLRRPGRRQRQPWGLADHPARQIGTGTRLACKSKQGFCQHNQALHSVHYSRVSCLNESCNCATVCAAEQPEPPSCIHSCHACLWHACPAHSLSATALRCVTYITHSGKGNFLLWCMPAAVRAAAAVSLAPPSRAGELVPGLRARAAGGQRGGRGGPLEPRATQCVMREGA